MRDALRRWLYRGRHHDSSSCGPSWSETLAQLSDDAARLRSADYRLKLRESNEQRHQHRVPTTKVVIGLGQFALKPFGDRAPWRRLRGGERPQNLPDALTGVCHKRSVGSAAPQSDGNTL